MKLTWPQQLHIELIGIHGQLERDVERQESEPPSTNPVWRGFQSRCLELDKRSLAAYKAILERIDREGMDWLVNGPSVLATSGEPPA